MTRLLVGLGNPGREYERTRHNIGQMVLDRLVSTSAWSKKFNGHLAEYSFQNQKIYLLKPQTYMNLSGESVAPAVHFYKLPLNEILVLHDELDLPFGQIGFKKEGGTAGHNGLKSIQQHLGTDKYLRMRLGIGRPPFGQVSNWVLGEFSGDEKIILDQYLEAALKALEFCLANGVDKASNNYNKKPLIT